MSFTEHCVKKGMYEECQKCNWWKKCYPNYPWTITTVVEALSLGEAVYRVKIVTPMCDKGVDFTA